MHFHSNGSGLGLVILAVLLIVACCRSGKSESKSSNQQ